MLTRAEADVMIAKIAAFMKKNDNAVGAPATRAGIARRTASMIDPHNSLSYPFRCAVSHCRLPTG